MMVKRVFRMLWVVLPGAAAWRPLPSQGADVAFYSVLKPRQFTQSGPAVPVAPPTNACSFQAIHHAPVP
jgi:hypothetical protein